MRKILCEIRKALFSYRMLCCVIIGLAFLYQPEIYLHGMEASFCDMDLGNAMQTSLGLGVFVMMATVLCTIPYADRYCWERKTRNQMYIQHRQGKLNYAVSKICATAFSGGCGLTIPFAVFCIIQYFLSPRDLFEPEMVNDSFTECIYFFLYGSAWATIALAFSTFTISPLITLAIPLWMERGLRLIAVAFKCDYLLVSDAIAVQCGSVYDSNQIIIIDILLFLTGVVIFMIRTVQMNYDA